MSPVNENRRPDDAGGTVDSPAMDEERTDGASGKGERRFWPMFLAQNGGVLTVVGGVYLMGESVGVTVQQVFATPSGQLGALLFLGGFILLFKGHKAELQAAREDDEWWLDDGKDGDDDE
jgi:hypothetical protein